METLFCLDGLFPCLPWAERGVTLKEGDNCGFWGGDVRHRRHTTLP